MVCAKLCQLLVERKLNHHYKVFVIGAEETPAYDRIRLSSYVDHRQREALVLRHEDWYSENGIELVVGAEVTSVDRENKVVGTGDGVEFDYDLLVFATGSRPSVPPIEGAGLANVFVYRTFGDLDRIIAAADGKQAGVVIGGGLLGLEAAQAVQKLGMRVSLVERSNYLMPQQINQEASRLLEKSVAEMAIEVHLGIRSTIIREQAGRLGVELDSGGEKHVVETDLVVFSAGVTPNSELAAGCGLATGLKGGIIVGEHLETSDPDVFAIGECALIGGRSYGLAVPGYAMARHLADRLQGEKVMPFGEPDVSTRLKMLGADVTIVGTPLEEGRRLEFSDQDHYRLVVLGPGGELRGALGVGEWPDSGKVQSIFARGGRVREREQRYFLEEGVLAPGGESLSLSEWPDDRIVCNCTSMSKGALSACLDSCHRDPDLLAAESQASTVCGSCRPLIEELCGLPAGAEAPVARRRMLLASAVAAFLVLLAIFAPPFGMAESVDSWRYRVDGLWRDRILKQVTGYSLLGVFSIGLLISLRKRFSWFRFGHFAKWRFFHATFGIVALVVLFAHTGFRFGHNLNFWLMFSFVGLNLLGAIAGIVAAVEAGGRSGLAQRARRVRPVLTYAHLLLFWPLPVLLIFHILSVYLY